MEKNNFLINMTDFVLKQNYTTTLDISQIDFYDKELSILEKIRNYANFLKQPLKLEMFVPCDEDGNVLEIPNPNNFLLDEIINGKYKELKDNYIKAKEKVLFVFKPHFDVSVIKHHILQDRNIEYLANFGELELTENAIKQIGL